MAQMSNEGASGAASNVPSDSDSPRINISNRPRRTVEVEYAKNPGKTLQRLMSYFFRRKLQVFWIFVAGCVVVGCSVTIPRLLSLAIDDISSGEFSDLNEVLLLMGCTYGLSCIFVFVQGRLTAQLSQNVVSTMRADLFGHIINLPVKSLDAHAHGDLMSRMTNDIDNVATTISQSLNSFISGILTVSGSVCMMFYLSAPLAAISMVTVVLVAITTKLLSAVMRRAYRRRQALLGSLNACAEEMISCYRTVAACDRAKEVSREFAETSDAYTKASIISEIIGGSMGPCMNSLSNFGFVLVAIFGGWFTLQGYISVGMISAFILYAKQVGRPIEEIANVYGQIQTALAGAERVFETLDEPPEDKSGDKSMADALGIVSFSHVNFSYTPGTEVLRDFNLSVPQGSKLALVGATGSGKTTVASLLMRLYRPESGVITIDGVDIQDISLDELRRSMAVVLQDTNLFSMSVRDNLRYLNPNVSDEDMRYAAERCCCKRMIEALPEGYDTYLHHAGASLSQGQRQLLAITRAFLADPKILILDEATSSVDTLTEMYIQRAMAELMKNRTGLIIAHRLSTIKDADAIVVMDKGRIVEAGTHDALLARKGRYYELYTTQFAGFAT